MNILRFIPRFSGLPAMATLPILARFRPQEKYILSVFMHLMRRESPGHGWLWRAGPRARGSSGACGGSVRPLAGRSPARRRRGVSRAPCSPLMCLTQRQGDAGIDRQTRAQGGNCRRPWPGRISGPAIHELLRYLSCGTRDQARHPSLACTGPGGHRGHISARSARKR